MKRASGLATAGLVSKKPRNSNVVSFKRRLLSVRSRHPSIEPLRGTIFLSKKAVYRHGSTSTHESPYEVNSIKAVQTSSSKLEMKQAFDKGKVKHLPWFQLKDAKATDKGITDSKETFAYPFVVKSYFGSRGEGNHKISTLKEFNDLKTSGKLSQGHIVEPFYTGTVEFRVHIANYGAIYSLRKLLKSDTPKEKRWIRNDDTCVWITEYVRKDANGRFLCFTSTPNPSFDKPNNWNEIVKECIKALEAVGGDLLAVDVKAQSNKDSKGHRRGNVDFVILEVNSAPAMGEITAEIYKEHIPKILEAKYGAFRK